MLDKIIPPDNPEKVTKWRWFIAIAVALTLFNGIAGRVGIAGVGAYASANQVKEQGHKLDKLLALQITAILRNLQ